MGLIRKRVYIKDLSYDQKKSMFSLLKTYYVNSNEPAFKDDLEEKEWGLLIFDENTEQIVGFSTQMLIHLNFDGNDIGVLFSGDTIIAKEHWGSMALSICFGELMMDLLKEYKNNNLYWMLISKGLRTYKYLPVFFIDYYPKVNVQTPVKIKELMDYLGLMKFPKGYDKSRGIITSNGQFLKKDFQPIPNPKKPHEEFFVKANPDYMLGDELLCLAELSMQNINPFMRRVLNNIK